MFDLADTPDAELLTAVLERVAAIDGVAATERELIDDLSLLEKLKGAVSAAQARVTTTLAHARTTREAARGVPAARRCRGLAQEIALARRTSPFRGVRDLGFSRALVEEMPDTLALLTRGEISEWKAMLVVRETAMLTREHRTQVDGELAGRLAHLGDAAAAAETRRIGYRLDPGSALRRHRGARADRSVSVRPAPDTMTYLTGFLPVEQGVACYAALTKVADSARASGDPRSRGQVMADTLVERVTGRSTASNLDLEVQVVMSADTLLGDGHTPAQVAGYGPIPASLGRRLVHEAARVWVRRLFTRPLDGALVAMDSRQRGFAGELREALVTRDQVCRTAWCDAPVRHADHVVPVADGGTTSADNGQGLCEACNYAKEAPGWSSSRGPGERHRVVVTTPTGHSYTSTAPDLPGTAIPPPKEHGDVVHFFSTPRTLDEELTRLVG